MGSDKFQRLANILSTGWDIELQEYKSVMSAYKVKTSQGVLSLKKTGAKLERLNFIKAAQDYLKENGFNNMAPLVVAKDGQPYFREKKDTYILSPWIVGKEPEYKSINHVQMMAFSLAELHRKSAGFKYLDGKVRAKYDKMPKKLEKRERELRLFKELAQSSSDKYDQFYLEHADWLISRAKDACNRINSTAYKRLLESSRQGYLCHGDIAVKNSVIKDDEVIFIDFDSMSQDLPVVDLWRLLRRALRRNQWSVDFINAVLVAYEQNRRLNADEREVLYALLTFPERAWRITHRYYEKRGREEWSQDMYYQELEEFLADRDAMDRFTFEGLDNI